MTSIAPVPDDFACVRCGHCCEWEGDVRVTESECETIAAHLGISFGEFMDRYTRLTHDRKGLSLIESEPSKHCIFYHGNPPTCRIQSIKPFHCTCFPFEWRFAGWEERCEGAHLKISTHLK